MNDLDRDDVFRILNALSNDPALLPLFPSEVTEHLLTNGLFDFDNYDVSPKGYVVIKAGRSS